MVEYQPLLTFAAHGHAALTVVFGPGENLLASGGADGKLCLWKIAGEQQEQVHCLDADVGAVRSVAYSPDGKLVAAAGDKTHLTVWDTLSGEQLARLDGHRGRVTCLAFSPGSKRLYSGSTDTTIVVWDMVGLDDE